MIELFFGGQDKVWPQSPHEEMKLIMKFTVCVYGWLSWFEMHEATRTVFLLPLDKMLVHRRVPPPPRNFSVTYLYTWVERDSAKVTCLAQEHSAMFLDHSQDRRHRDAPGPQHVQRELKQQRERANKI